MLPKLLTSLPGPRAQEILDMDDRFVSPSYTRSYPFVAEHGSGAMVFDPDGNRFLDLNAGIAVCATGHCHPEVVQAIQNQAGRLIHMSGTDFYYGAQTKLASKLSEIAPGDGDHKVFFSNSGAESVECALKLARYKTGRKQMIAFLGAFHGRTMGALSLTASKSVQRQAFAPLVPQVTHVPYPYVYRSPFGDPESCAQDCLDYIEKTLFTKLLDPTEVAGIIIEPIQGEGGYVDAPVSFLQGLRELTQRHGIMFIADEVQSGAGRTGRMFAIEESGVVPDIICMAKGIASGMPLGCTVASADVMDWKPGMHASTFGGNPVSCAAALKTIELLEKELLENCRNMGEHTLGRLRKMAEKSPFIGDVRGRGLMIGAELVWDKKTKKPAPDLRDRVVTWCFEQGLLILGCGPNSLRLTPPLNITQTQIDYALDLIERGIEECSR